MPNLHVFLICVSYALLVYLYVRGYGHPPIINLARSQANQLPEAFELG